MSMQPDTDYLRPTAPIDLTAKSPLELLKETCQSVGKDIGEQRRNRRMKSLSPRQAWKKAHGSLGSPSSSDSCPISTPPKAPTMMPMSNLSPTYGTPFTALPLEQPKLHDPQQPQPHNHNVFTADYQVLYHQLLCQLELQKLKSQLFLNGATPTPFSSLNGYGDLNLPTLPEMPNLNPFQFSTANYTQFDKLNPYRLLLANPLLGASKINEHPPLQSQHECHWVTGESLYCGRKFCSNSDLMTHLSEHVHANQLDFKFRTRFNAGLCKTQLQDLPPFDYGARFSPYYMQNKSLSMRQ